MADTCQGYGADERCGDCESGLHARCVGRPQTFYHMSQRPCDGHVCACTVCVDR